MRYWLDAEFIEDGRTIDPLSIGIVAEDGREFYREFHEADFHRADPWVRENVFPHLTHWRLNHGSEPHTGCPAKSAEFIREEVLEFCDPGRYGDPEFWGYYADYDWVALCQLFGRMVDLPPGWPMYCRDLKQWLDDLGGKDKVKMPVQSNEHHALADAQWNRALWVALMEKQHGPMIWLRESERKRGQA